MHPSKRPKLETNSGRKFQDWWTEKYGVVEHCGKALCALCSGSVVCRTSSVKRHFEANHENIVGISDGEQKEYILRELEKFRSRLAAGEVIQDESNRKFLSWWTEKYGVVERNGRAYCVMCSGSVVCKAASVKRHFEGNHENIMLLGDAEQKRYIAQEVQRYLSQPPEAFIAPPAKANNEDNNRKFQEIWTEQYGVIEFSGKALCSICSRMIVRRTSSIKRHFITNHEDIAALSDEEQRQYVAREVENYRNPSARLRTKAEEVDVSFQELWTEKYGVVDDNGKALCVLCPGYKCIACDAASIAHHFESYHEKISELEDDEQKAYITHELQKYNNHTVEPIKYVHDSGRKFQPSWTENYGMIEDLVTGKSLCVLCSGSVVCRTSSVKRHFEANHENIVALSEEERKAHIAKELQKFRSQQNNKSSQEEGGRKFQEWWTEKFAVVEHHGKALCILCSASVLCQAANVKRHFESNHKNIYSLSDVEQREYILRELGTYRTRCTVGSRVVPKPNCLVAASFKVAHFIAQNGKPISDVSFIKTAMLSFADALFEDFPNRDKIVQRITEMPTSRNTVKSRMLRMNQEISEQLQCDLQLSPVFSLCLTDSTDVSDHMRLAVIVRYLAGDELREELLRLITLPGTATGIDIFSTMMQEFANKNISVSKIASVSTDGSFCMVSRLSGFIHYLLQEVNHPLVQFHCLLYQQALFDKTSLTKLEGVMKTVTKIVNLIASKARNHQQFQMLFQEVENQYAALVMHNSIRWLSRGLVLTHFVACLYDIRLFLNGERQEHTELTDVEWLTNLMFFADFTKHLHELNRKLQGIGKTADSMFSDIKVFEKKLGIFKKDLDTEQLKYFPSLKQHLDTCDVFVYGLASRTYVCKQFSETIGYAQEVVMNRFIHFKSLEKTLYFVSNPHKVQYEELNLSELEWLGLDELEMELVELQESSVWKAKFTNLGITLEQIERERMEGKKITSAENEILKVWNSLPACFGSLKKLATAVLTFFGSTHFCEQLFSSRNFTKSDARNRLTDEMSAACMALQTTKYQPRITKLAGEIQQQKSH